MTCLRCVTPRQCDAFGCAPGTFPTSTARTRPKPRVARESTVEEHLIAVVEALAGAVRKAQWIGRRGCPDRFVMLPARWGKPAMQIWVEVKRPGKDAEEHQAREHDLMHEYGCVVVTLDTIEKIDSFFHLLYKP